MQYIVGVDIGGTFTDCVVTDTEGTLTLGKALSTPEDFSIGAIHAVRDAAKNLGLNSEQDLLSLTRLFFHACTVADNTLVTRTGVKAGLITTRGFGDTILMMRGRTTEDLTETEAFRAASQSKPDPIIPRPLIEEVTERIDYRGSVLIQLDTAEVETAIRSLLANGVESIAICLLWAISNDSHEKIIARAIGENHPSIYLSLSSEIAPYLGEYERTATTALNAYIGPKIAAYLTNLNRVLGERGLKNPPLIMQSYGGVLGVEATCKNAVGTIESGPAAGVVGSNFIGKYIGVSNILATDMGGTTFKVSVVRDGNIEKTYKPSILRYQIFLSKIWVESIGAGGGSIAWIDPETRLLRVGPQGAGAHPGPVCYGLGGTEPTVSDADLVLGYLNEEYFFGGKMKLQKEKALRALEEKIGKPLGMTPVEAASGIYRITNSHMSDLIRRATVERGYDPRDFTLFAFGGAAPVHAGRYARDLGIKHVVVPLTASVHGATGLISSDVVYEYGKSDHLFVPSDVRRVNANFAALLDKAQNDLRAAGFKPEDSTVIRSLDMRYRYQVHELNAPFRPGVGEITEEELEEVCARFDLLYEQAYGPGSAYREVGKEIMNFRVLAVGALHKPRLKRYPVRQKSPEQALKGKRKVYFEEDRDFVLTRIYDFGRLTAGTEIAGPAVIETPITTIVVNPKDRAIVDEFLNLKIFIGEQESR